MTLHDGRPRRIPKKTRDSATPSGPSGRPQGAAQPPAGATTAKPASQQVAASGRRAKSRRAPTVIVGRRGGSRPRIVKRSDTGNASWLGRVRKTLGTMPAWALSLVIHLIVLLILALVTVVVIEREPEVIIAATIAQEETALEEFTEIEWEPTESLSEESPAETLELAAPQQLAPVIGHLPGPTAPAAEPQRGHEIDLTQVVDGSGKAVEMSKPVTFYGTESRGNRFVFLIDNSPNMNHEGRMLMALDQLWRAVQQMKAKQFFYVVFYSNRAYPLFFPDTTNKMVEATRNNKARLRQWLATVELCDSRPRGADAIKEALSLTRSVQPSTVFFLTDGDYAVTVKRELDALPLACPLNVIALLPNPQKAHTQAFQRTAEKLAMFDEIARHHRGFFSGVPATSNFPGGTYRPRRRDTPGPVWGTYETD